MFAPSDPQPGTLLLGSVEVKNKKKSDICIFTAWVEKLKETCETPQTFCILISLSARSSSPTASNPVLHHRFSHFCHGSTNVPTQSDSGGLNLTDCSLDPSSNTCLRHQTSEGALWYLPQDVSGRSFNPVGWETDRACLFGPSNRCWSGVRSACGQRSPSCGVRFEAYL